MGRHNGLIYAVAVVALLVSAERRQYRFAVNQWLWELPAGSVDGRVPPEDAHRGRLLGG